MVDLRILLAAMAAAGVASAPAWADTVTWRGASTVTLINALGPPPEGTSHDLTSYQPAGNLFGADINESPYLLWDIGRVPTAGDTALFNLQRSTQNTAYADAEILISGAFSPDHMILRAASWQRPANSPVRIQKNLSLQSLRLEQGYTTSTGPQLIVDSGFVLTLSGTNPMTFGGDQGGWQGLTVGSGATLQFNGASQTFDQFNTSYLHGTNGFGGSGPLAGGVGGVVEFTNAAATITLGNPGRVFARVGAAGDVVAGAIVIGQQQLRVHSETTWLNPSGLGAIILRAATGQPLIEAIDNKPLHNMANVSLIVRHTEVNGHIIDIPEASFRSILFGGSLTSTRSNSFRMMGNLNLTGGTGIAGNGLTGDSGTVATESDFGLVFDNGNQLASRLLLNGHTLTVTRGALVQKRAGSDNNAVAIIDANGSVLNIGGDLVFSEGSRPAGNRNAAEDALLEFRRVGVIGNATTVINLHGSFSSNSRSTTQGALHLSTMNLLGGTGPGGVVTFEVAADRSQGLVTSSYALGTVNIGSATQTAHVKLVNDFLNDNDAANLEKVKDGEVLLAGVLNIAAGSILDVNGQGVKVVNLLSISPTGLLDLNTGLALAEDDVVKSFFGVGDQSAVWELLASQVIDSSNAGFSFTASYDSLDNATYWVAIPEPAALSLLGVGGLMMLRRRRS
jgi:hypothetical protein